MNGLFTIANSLSSAFPFFYALACIVGSAIVFYEFRRKGYSSETSIAIILSCLIFGIIGTKAVTISPESFFVFLKTGILPTTGEKSALGGILGVLAGAEIARRSLGFKNSLTDNFAFAWLAMLIIARFGCLLGGCCFGTPTEMPWGISYAESFPAFHTHASAGLIGHSALHSLPVHPAQLYEILFCVAILFLLFKNKNRFKSAGNLFNFSLLLYGICRFFEEFVRSGDFKNGFLKEIQWILLAAVTIILTIILLKEKYINSFKREEITAGNLFKNWLFFGTISLPVVVLKNWFSPLEFTTIITISALAFLLLVYRHVVLKTQLSTQFALSAVIVMTCIFMGQAPAKKDSTDSGTHYLTVSGGGMMGEYTEICGPDHEYNGGGVGIAITEQEGAFKKMTFGIRGYAAFDKTAPYTSFYYDSTYVPEPVRKREFFGINPYLQFEDRWIAGSVGAHIGKFSDVSADFLGFISPDSSIAIFPQGFLRVGPSDIFFLDVHFANHFPSPFPANRFQFGIGSGFGAKDGTMVRTGISDAGFYVNPSIVINKYFTFDPFIAFAQEDHYQFALRLHYRIYDMESPFR